VALYDKRIADKEVEIKVAKTNSEKERDIAVSEVVVDTGAKLEENKGITGMYTKYGKYFSMVLEFLLIYSYISNAKYLKKLRLQNAPPLLRMLKRRKGY